LRFRINVLGALALAAYLALVLLSYVQAPALWRSRKDVPQANAFFDSLADTVPPVGLYRLFDGNEAVIVSYFIPLALATIAAILLILMLRRRGDAADAAVVKLIGRWSLAFAAVCFFAYPLFTQDFW